MRPDGGDRLGFASCAGGTHRLLQEQTSSLSRVEAMGYVLLQKLQLRLHSESHAIAKWLLEARELTGGFRSSQVRWRSFARKVGMVGSDHEQGHGA